MMWIFAQIFWSTANNAPITMEHKPYVPIIVNRLPVDSPAIVQYAYYHNFPLLFPLSPVQTQGTAIHVSNGIWLTAAHVVAGGFDMYLVTDQNEQITTKIIGLDAHHDIAILSTKESLFTYPVIQRLDNYDPTYESLIKSEGYRGGELTVNQVKNIRYSEIESGIILWDGVVEPGMSGGMLGNISTNQMMGMILSYEPSKNISRALSIQWIIDNFSKIMSPEKSVQVHLDVRKAESFCTFHEILFESVPEGLRIISLPSKNDNFGLQIDDIIIHQSDIKVTCDILSVSKTSLITVQRNNIRFHWIIHP